ncbi:hypothetical protein BJX76DRAFT_357726 [Aspergillus varians]
MRLAASLRYLYSPRSSQLMLIFWRGSSPTRANQRPRDIHSIGQHPVVVTECYRSATDTNPITIAIVCGADYSWPKYCGQCQCRTGDFYVGETSSLSFLHFLRKTVKAYVGPVSFTDVERHHIALETDAAPIKSGSLEYTSEKLYSLLDSYFEATSSVLDLFTADELDTLIANRSLPREQIHCLPIASEDAAALDLALAIGAQVRGSSDEVQISKTYFHRSRKVALDNMLMSQGPSTVRLFLLLAFYMLGACDRNAASMFLAIASKAAEILGLHETAGDINAQQDESSRLRIFHSLRNIDILSSFILGRPKNLPNIRSRTARPNSEADDSSVQTVFTAIVTASSLLEDTVTALGESKDILHVPTAESLLQRLRQWSRALPLNIRQFTGISLQGSSLGSADRQSLMGSIHVSCVYYFAVILITRPFLVAYLMSRLRGKAPDHLISDPDQASDINIKNNKVSRLAQVCVSSAIYMVEMCVKAKASGFTFGNLCFLKAWIFGAGLVLGFSMFAGEPRKDIEESFHGACTTLAEIARTSPQAQLYHEILLSFSEAVAKYRQRVAEELNQAVQGYMDRILTIDVSLDPNNSTMSMDGSWDDWLAGVPAESNVDRRALDLVSGTEGARTLLQMSTFGENGGAWPDADMELPDCFGPAPASFDQLFYTVE